MFCIKTNENLFWTINSRIRSHQQVSILYLSYATSAVDPLDQCRLWMMAYFYSFNVIWSMTGRRKPLSSMHPDFAKFSGLNRDSNPGPLAPKARIIPLDHWAVNIHRHLSMPVAKCTVMEEEQLAFSWIRYPIGKHAQRGARTHDPEIKSLMLYRLS